MKNIEELIKNIKKYKKTVIQRKLKSKKNSVAYVTLEGKPRVLKWYVPGFKNQMKTEQKILEKAASKLNIPTIHEIDDENNVLIMSYIIGENLCDLINDKVITSSEKEKLMILLADWFINFHNYFKKAEQFFIRGDSTLRNFIFSDRIWGVDFEESRIGSPVEDIGGLCSSILTTDPMFTDEKLMLCKKFIDSYVKKAPGRILNINDEISYSILKKIQWRPEQEEILREYSHIIKEKGIL